MSTLQQVSSNKRSRKKKKKLNSLRSLFNCPQKKGIVVKVRIMTPKKPNSAKRKVARVKLSNKYMVTTKIKGQGHNLQTYSQVLVCGGRANDLPGVRYNMIRGKYSFHWKERILRVKARSKFGIGLEDFQMLQDEFLEKDI